MFSINNIYNPLYYFIVGFITVTLYLVLIDPILEQYNKKNGYLGNIITFTIAFLFTFSVSYLLLYNYKKCNKLYINIISNKVKNNKYNDTSTLYLKNVSNMDYEKSSYEQKTNHGIHMYKDLNMSLPVEFNS